MNDVYLGKMVWWDDNGVWSLGIVTKVGERSSEIYWIDCDTVGVWRNATVAKGYFSRDERVYEG